MLHNTNIFKKFDIVFLSELTFVLKRETFSIDDHIFEEKELGDTLFFITKGSIVLIHKKSHTFVKELGVEEFFGSYAFFSGQPRTVTAISKHFTEVLSLPRKRFIEWAEEFPEAKEMHTTIAQKINKAQDVTDIGLVCYVCNRLGHMSVHCDQFFKIKGNLKRHLQRLRTKRIGRGQTMEEFGGQEQRRDDSINTDEEVKDMRGGQSKPQGSLSSSVSASEELGIAEE